MSTVEEFEVALERAQADDRLPPGTVVRDVTDWADGEAWRFEFRTGFLPVVNGSSPHPHDFLRTPGQASQDLAVEHVERMLQKHVEEWAFMLKHLPGLEAVAECSCIHRYVRRA